MESVVLSPMSANQDFFAVPAPPRNVCCNLSTWNFLVSTSEVTGLRRLCLLLREGDLPWDHPLFSFPCSVLLLPIKTMHFVQLLKALCYLPDVMLPDP